MHVFLCLRITGPVAPFFCGIFRLVYSYPKKEKCPLLFSIKSLARKIIMYIFAAETLKR